MTFCIRMPALRCAAALVSLQLLSACAQTPVPVERYLLPASTAAAASTPVATSRTLALRELRTAAFLDGEGLILQLDDISLHAARQHRWGEALSLQLRRLLRQGLQQKVSALLVLDADAVRTADLQLLVEVDGFHGMPDGFALVAGRWQLHTNTSTLISAENFRVRVPLADDGYPALVRALGQGWDDVVRQVAERVAGSMTPPATN